MRAVKQHRIALSFDKSQIDCIEKHAEQLDIPAPHLIYSCIRIATELSSFYGNIGIEGNSILKFHFYEHIGKLYKDAKTTEEKEAIDKLLVGFHNFFDYTDGLIKLSPFATDWKFVNKFK